MTRLIAPALLVSLMLSGCAGLVFTYEHGGREVQAQGWSTEQTLAFMALAEKKKKDCANGVAHEKRKFRAESKPKYEDAYTRPLLPGNTTYVEAQARVECAPQPIKKPPG